MATTYYVAPAASGGNNANPGTISQPKETIAAGIALLAPGDTLRIRAGTYAAPVLTGRHKGVVHPLTIPNGPGVGWPDPASCTSIEGYPGETVICTTGAVDTPNVIAVLGGNYIRLATLTVVGGDKVFSSSGNAATAVNLNGSTHFIFEYCDVSNPENGRDSGHHGVMGGDDPGTDCQLILRHNHVHDCVSAAYPNGENAFYLGGNNITVENNHIHHIRRGGIRVGGEGYEGETGIVIRGNDIHDLYHDNGVTLGTYGTAILIYGGGHTVDANRVYRTLYGIQIYNGAVDPLIANNVLHDNLVGLAMEPSAANPANSARVYHNTCYHNVNYGIWVHTSMLNTTGIFIQNNIAYDNYSGSEAWQIYDPGALATIGSNLLHPIDPLFMDSGAGDFHLQATSPAIGAGMPLADVTSDFDGMARPAAPAIGAYEFETAPVVEPILGLIPLFGRRNPTTLLRSPEPEPEPVVATPKTPMKGMYVRRKPPVR